MLATRSNLTSVFADYKKMSKLKLLGEIVLGGILVDGFIYFALWLWQLKRDRNATNAVTTNAKGGKFEPLESTEKTVFFKTLFFPESEIPCRYHYQANGCQREDCELSHEAALLDTLIFHLSEAKKTAYFCIYLLSCYELSQEIVKLRRRGIRIRVITDGNFSDESTSKIGLLRAEGIAIRHNPPGFLMHHKFVILDDSVLMNGSFNWTWQAITGNHENLCITNNKAMVEEYVNEFKSLWDKFEPKMSKATTHATDSCP